jgi:methylated-DNA-[protein]-cysteine S-methyltransferase
MECCYRWLDTPIGRVLTVASADALLRLDLPGDRTPIVPEGAVEDPTTVLQEVGTQLQAYFKRQLQRFDLPLDPQGTPFQQAVWRQLLAIPYGQTTTYGAIARELGQPAAMRAVGAANGANPIPIIIPCHRVIGSDGTLVGYGGGLPAKEWLLALEGVRVTPTITTPPAPRPVRPRQRSLF